MNSKSEEHNESMNCWWRYSTKSCSTEELEEIITAPSNGYYALPSDPYSKVYEGIYISDGSTAKNIPLLQSLNISHVLNAAFGSDLSLNLIDTSPEFYAGSQIEFLGIEAIDMSSFYLFPYFEESANFIEKALVKKGNVLVHCKQGISRSATLVLAFLMIKEGLTIQEATRTVRSKREIRPNSGFLKQLCYLNELLIDKSERKLTTQQLVL